MGKLSIDTVFLEPIVQKDSIVELSVNLKVTQSLYTQL